jgi:phosphoribosylglycinamide formyltransferase 2
MTINTPLKSNAKKFLILGSGELGREVVIAAHKLGVETIAVDKYPNAPAMNLATKSYVCDMKNEDEVLEVIRREKPDFILPEIEAINIDALFKASDEGFEVIPNAKAVSLTMNRRGIRELASKTLKLKTSKYEFVKSLEELQNAVKKVGIPCVVKPVMSSSGHGQSTIKTQNDIAKSWKIAQEGARGDASELIVEEFVKFDYEITLLTVNNGKTIKTCPPIGHVQEGGDYIYSWQPMKMSEKAIKSSQNIAKKVVKELGGRGLFGVELFIKGDEVYFSEVSPRPHDTGLVTLATQNKSEFALHVLAILGLPIEFDLVSNGVSAAYKAKKESITPSFKLPNTAFANNCIVNFFNKPVSHKGRRMGVVLVQGEVEKSLEQAKKIINGIKEANN